MAKCDAPTLNGTELAAPEFRDALLLRHARTPGDLPSHCHGCGAKFDVRHALECKVGGLVILRHDEINEELCDLASKTLAPSAVCAEPMIHPDALLRRLRLRSPSPQSNAYPAQATKSGEVSSSEASGPVGRKLSLTSE
jgi:hypothetical protein